MTAKEILKNIRLFILHRENIFLKKICIPVKNLVESPVGADDRMNGVIFLWVRMAYSIFPLYPLTPVTSQTQSKMLPTL